MEFLSITKLHFDVHSVFLVVLLQKRRESARVRMWGCLTGDSGISRQISPLQPMVLNRSTNFSLISLIIWLTWFNQLTLLFSAVLWPCRIFASRSWILVSICTRLFFSSWYIRMTWKTTVFPSSSSIFVVLTSSLIVPWQLSCALKFMISDSISARLLGKSWNFFRNSSTNLPGRRISLEVGNVLFKALESFWTAWRIEVSLVSRRFFDARICSWMSEGLNSIVRWREEDRPSVVSIRLCEFREENWLASVAVEQEPDDHFRRSSSRISRSIAEWINRSVSPSIREDRLTSNSFTWRFNWCILSSWIFTSFSRATRSSWTRSICFFWYIDNLDDDKTVSRVEDHLTERTCVVSLRSFVRISLSCFVCHWWRSGNKTGRLEESSVGQRTHFASFDVVELTSELILLFLQRLLRFL